MTLRKALFWLHLGVGLAAGAFLVSMAATGILMAFAPQIIEASERGSSRAGSPEGPRRDLASLLTAAARSSPGSKPASVALYRDPAKAALVGLGEAKAVYVDPRSGLATGPGSPARGFFESVEHWHRWLGSRDVGKPFTGAAALGLVFLSLSGLWLWRPRNFAGLKASIGLRSGLRGRAHPLNRHNAIGFWASPLLLLMACTGAIMSYRWAGNLLYTLAGSPAPREEGGARPPAPAREGRVAGGGGPAVPDYSNLHVSLDSLADWAEARAPAWTALTLRAPRKPGGPWSGMVQEPGFASFPRRSQFSLDGGTGAVPKWQPFSEQPAGRKLRSWMTPLHTGRGFGWPGQALAALAALALLSQVWTGLSMTRRRFARRASAPREAVPAAAMPERNNAPG